MEPPGFGHGRVEATIGSLLTVHVREQSLGVALVGETGFILATGPDTVRGADVAFVRQERIDALGDTVKYWPEAPDLVVEVVSPGDRPRGVTEKALQWLDSGTRLVLAVDPSVRTITAYRGRDDVRLHVEGETVDAGDAVPGWTLDVTAAFD